MGRQRAERGDNDLTRHGLRPARRAWLTPGLVRMVVMLALGLGATLPLQAAVELPLTLRHCPVAVTVADPDALVRCNRAERAPTRNQQLNNDVQLMRLTLHNPEPGPQRVRLTIGPYYLAWIELFRPQADVSKGEAIQPTRLLGTRAEYRPLPATIAPNLIMVGRGGAFSADTESATLGGHAFTLPLRRGRNDLLLRLQAPGFSHVAIQAAPADSGAPDSRIISISVHLGMLATLAGLALVGLLLRPNLINARLLLFNTLILIQVGLGSGFIPVLIPDVAGHGAMTLFMALIILRTATWGWLYQALIAPHVAGTWYTLACRITYLLCAVAVALFLADWLVTARALTFALIFGIPIVHTVAALQARTLVPLTKHALLGSLIIYNLLQALAIALLTLETGQSNLPVWISRALDLIVPLLAMGTVLLRNRASDQHLADAEQELARNAAALEAETAMREEKRTLLDMLTHEIRNPLATIKLASRALQGQLADDGEPARRRLRNIDTAIATIDEVIERCDVHNSMEDSGIAPAIQRLTLPSLLAATAERLGHAERFIIHADSPQEVDSDPQLLEILLANLMDNAGKYSPDGSPITLETFALGDDAGWGLRIRNAIAPGMAPDPARLFERYYRHEHARRQGGSGLGLSLCQRIAEILGGTLDYRPGSNAVTFELRMKSEPTC